MTLKFTGVYVSLQTPFTNKGDIDVASLKKEVDFCIQAGSHGLVIPVMAGEFFALSDVERRRVAEITVAQTAKRVPVLIGVQGVSREHAVAFARHAVEIEADGLIAMPPYLRTPSEAEITAYYQAISQVSNLSIMIQNAPGPLGTPLSPTALARLVEQVPHVRYVKEEVRPPGPRISALLNNAPPRLEGVMGGANGLWVLNELERGACGTMPAAPFVDIQVKIWDLYQASDRIEAQNLQNQLLPVINLGSLYGVTFNKEILKRRGIIADTYTRDPQKQVMDVVDLFELERGLERLASFFTV
jgi:4-hydroxy-tetrahydrodipicolinate synthase